MKPAQVARIRAAFASPATIPTIPAREQQLEACRRRSPPAVDTMRWPLDQDLAETAAATAWPQRRWATRGSSSPAASGWRPSARTTTRRPCCWAATMSTSRGMERSGSMAPLIVNKIESFVRIRFDSFRLVYPVCWFCRLYNNLR